jgi:hypothetical protein
VLMVISDGSDLRCRGSCGQYDHRERESVPVHLDLRALRV